MKMGVISDAIDSLQDWCSNLFKDGVKSQFDGISELLSDTFSQTTGSGGLVSTYLTSHPVHFTGGAASGSTIWSTIETLCNNVVVPIGGFVLTIILLQDLISTIMRGNNFSVEYILHCIGSIWFWHVSLRKWISNLIWLW